MLVSLLMAIPAKIIALIDRLNQELDQTEQEATEGLNLARAALSRFPDNTMLIGLFAYLNNALLFVDYSRADIQTTVDNISPADVPAEIIQETGEGLAELLGRILEVKINVNRIKTRLANLL